MAWDVGSRAKFISREKMTRGYLLRETKHGVVLEKYYDDEQTRIDVVAEFEGARINVEYNYLMCLDEARKFVGDSKVPIYVDLTAWDSENHQ